jgi:replicative DNA helicase
MISSLTGVPVWYLETGNWRKNEEMVVKVRSAWPLIKNYQYHHYHVGSKNIDQICSMIRRWHLSHVGRGNQAVIAYDYIKLTGEKVGQNWAEHQAIGDKIDKLKRISEELQAPIITAMQLNRSGESFNRKGADVTDDASAISLSDRLQWFASFVAIFRRKTVDELALDTPQFGTHKLIPTKTRFQGKDAAGHQDIVRRLDCTGKETWAQNYLNYRVENFNITEHGSLVEIAARQREQYELNDQNQNDGELL